MDVIAVLNGIKNGVLDLKDIEILKSAYDMQNRNVEQLQTSNSLYAERHTLISEKADRLEKENKALKTENDDLRSKIASATPQEPYQPSHGAFGLLVLYRAKNTNSLWDGELQSPFCSQIEFESAMHELKEAGFLKFRTASETRGVEYGLTQAGREYVLSIKEVNANC